MMDITSFLKQQQEKIKEDEKYLKSLPINKKLEKEGVNFNVETDRDLLKNLKKIVVEEKPPVKIINKKKIAKITPPPIVHSVDVKNLSKEKKTENVRKITREPSIQTVSSVMRTENEERKIKNVKIIPKKKPSPVVSSIVRTENKPKEKISSEKPQPVKVEVKKKTNLVNLGFSNNDFLEEQRMFESLKRKRNTSQRGDNNSYEKKQNIRFQNNRENPRIENRRTNYPPKTNEHRFRNENKPRFDQPRTNYPPKNNFSSRSRNNFSDHDFEEERRLFEMSKRKKIPVQSYGNNNRGFNRTNPSRRPNFVHKDPFPRHNVVRRHNTERGNPRFNTERGNNQRVNLSHTTERESPFPKHYVVRRYAPERRTVQKKLMHQTKAPLRVNQNLNKNVPPRNLTTHRPPKKKENFGDVNKKTGSSGFSNEDFLAEQRLFEKMNKNRKGKYLIKELRKELKSSNPVKKRKRKEEVQIHIKPSKYIVKNNIYQILNSESPIDVENNNLNEVEESTLDYDITTLLPTDRIISSSKRVVQNRTGHKIVLKNIPNDTSKEEIQMFLFDIGEITRLNINREKRYSEFESMEHCLKRKNLTDFKGSKIECFFMNHVSIPLVPFMCRVEAPILFLTTKKLSNEIEKIFGPNISSQCVIRDIGEMGMTNITNFHVEFPKEEYAKRMLKEDEGHFYSVYRVPCTFNAADKRNFSIEVSNLPKYASLKEIKVFFKKFDDIISINSSEKGLERKKVYQISFVSTKGVENLLKQNSIIYRGVELKFDRFQIEMSGKVKWKKKKKKKR